MNYYNIAKKYIEYNHNYISRGEFLFFFQFAKITEEQRDDFYQFMTNKFKCNWGIKHCQQYIYECNKKYILTKIN